VFDFPVLGVTDYHSLAAPCFEDPQDRDTTLADLVDLDGDGLPEWLFNGDGEVVDGMSYGRVTVLHGFEPPYDDPTRW